MTVCYDNINKASIHLSSVGSIHMDYLILKKSVVVGLEYCLFKGCKEK